ncbi:MAG: NHLP bacteriocin export ABC transporter permease/ATPase subunit [Acidobacteriota bacterium]
MFEIGGNEPLPLASDDAAWLIESGGVEVFYRRRLGDAVGRRRHLASFDAGQIVFGLGCTQALTTEGVALSSTRVRRIDLASVEAIDDAAGRAALKPMVEGWVTGLLAGLAGATADGAVPTSARDIKAGQEVRLTSGDAVTASGADVVWIRHIAGRSALLGQDALIIAPSNRLMPVTRSAWLRAEEKTVLSCIGTAILIRSRGIWPSLTGLHGVLLEHLAQMDQRDDVQRRRRIEQRGQFDLSAMRSGQAQLAAVLDAGTEATLRLDESQDPIFAACRLVAESMGLTLRMPPKSAFSSGVNNLTQTVRQIGKTSRIRTRRVRLTGTWWREDNGPLFALLVHAESQVGSDGGSVRKQVSPVALIPSSSTHYEIVDPVDGNRTPLSEALARRIDEDAFMFYRPLPEKAVGKRDLVRIAFAGRGEDLKMILKVGVFGGILSLLLPIVTGHVFGQVIPSSDRAQLLQLALALFAAAFASGAFHMTRAIAVLRLGGKIESALQAAVWDRLLALPMSFFKRYTVGDLVARSLGIDAIRGLLLGNAITSILGAIFSVFSFALLFYYQRTLAVMATGLVLVLGLVTLVLTSLQIRYQRRLLHMQGKIASLVFGLIHGIAKLRASGSEPRAYALWAENFAQQRDHTIRAQRLANVQAAFGAFYGLIITAVIFSVMGLAQLLELEIAISEFLAFSAALGQFQAAILSLIQVLASVLSIVPLWERMAPILQERPEVDASKAEIGAMKGDIEFNHVSFRYHQDGPLVLDNVSFRARPGEFIALVGASGSGKSSCVRLLLSFEQPTTGSIYYDGQDLPSLDVDSVRRQIGVVLQDGRSMSGSILSNVVGQRGLSTSDAMDALIKAGLEKDIAEMPMGLYTMVSEGAGTFSAGQLQRLMIASAIVDKPKVLILDEATSALDNRTQTIVSESLQALKATRIVVAHRLSTIKHADRIYVLDRGRIVETGTYDELLQQDGVFAALAERQMQ